MLAPLYLKLGAIFVFCVASLTYLFTSTTLVKQPDLSRYLHSPPIPNIVHYTQLLREPSSEIKFEFKHFIAAYGASLRLKPEIIYIHTDAPEDTIARAYDPNSNIWTRLVLGLPNVHINKVQAPKRASISGTAIDKVEHRSDFVRMDAVQKYGGLYLDWDVHVLRDLKPLRESGFANIVGREKGGGINNGCWMSQKGTLMMEVWSKAANVAFDGKWTTHSVEMLTKVAERLVSKPKEVLIMDMKAFSPSSWKGYDVDKLFEVHLETPGYASTYASKVVTAVNGALGEWEDPTTYESWQVDYSSTYLLHAFRPPAPGALANYSGITPAYVYAQQSNYARAVFPAMRHAMDAGLFSAEDF